MRKPSRLRYRNLIHGHSTVWLTLEVPVPWEDRPLHGVEGARHHHRRVSELVPERVDGFRPVPLGMARGGLIPALPSGDPGTRVTGERREKGLAGLLLARRRPRR